MQRPKIRLNWRVVQWLVIGSFAWAVADLAGATSQLTKSVIELGKTVNYDTSGLSKAGELISAIRVMLYANGAIAFAAGLWSIFTDRGEKAIQGLWVSTAGITIIGVSSIALSLTGFRDISAVMVLVGLLYFVAGIGTLVWFTGLQWALLWVKGKLNP